MKFKISSKSLTEKTENNEHKLEEEFGLLKYDSQEHEIRLKKVQELKDLNIDPWPENLEDKDVNSSIEEIKKDFELSNQTKEYMIAGRLMSIRLHGKTIFADLQDNQRIQIYFKKDNLAPDKFEFFKKFIDIGDIIWVKGNSFRTKMGEITLDIKDFKLLSKSLYPLPEKFHGISNIEIKYRQRYLDLIVNQETRERFIKRGKLLKSIRDYLDNNGYIEVETPMLHPIAGGANAKPFITHHNALNSDFYLRIAPELYLKRLVVGGFDKVYEVNRNFRNEGISTRHNPEFTMVEFYTAYKDFNYAMEFTENLLRYCANQVSNSLELKFGNHILDFSKPFERISIEDSVKLYGKLTDKDLNSDNIDKVIEKYKVKLKTDSASRDEKIFGLFESIVEPNLIQPTFIIDFPIEVSPLSKRNPNNPEFASRFELFIAGMELSNGYNELNDPFDQAKRFQDQLKAYQAGDEEAHQFDSDYILALEYGLPPTVGVGIGIDRLAMFLTNTTSIKEIILFPTLKRLKNN